MTELLASIGATVGYWDDFLKLLLALLKLFK